MTMSATIQTSNVIRRDILVQRNGPTLKSDIVRRVSLEYFKRNVVLSSCVGKDEAACASADDEDFYVC
jgi:hypothetical protein